MNRELLKLEVFFSAHIFLLKFHKLNFMGYKVLRFGGYKVCTVYKYSDQKTLNLKTFNLSYAKVELFYEFHHYRIAYEQAFPREVKVVVFYYEISLLYALG